MFSRYHNTFNVTLKARCMYRSWLLSLMSWKTSFFEMSCKNYELPLFLPMITSIGCTLQILHVGHFGYKGNQTIFMYMSIKEEHVEHERASFYAYVMTLHTTSSTSRIHSTFLKTNTTYNFIKSSFQSLNYIQRNAYNFKQNIFC